MSVLRVGAPAGRLLAGDARPSRAANTVVPAEAFRRGSDDVEQDRAKAAGDFTLRGALADGSPVEARVHQSLLGPTRVTVSHADREFDTTHGYVA